jgi:non-ribosomal peptide synthetase component E (peptide arylation enzyme)
VTAADERRARDDLRAAWRTAGLYADLTVRQAIVAGGVAHGSDRIVFAQVDGDTTAVTLAELVERSEACAQRLAGAEVRVGDTVVVQTRVDLSGTEVVVPREGAPAPTVQELQEVAAAAGLAAHKAPTKVVVMRALPRTAAGKVRKRDLRSLF